MKKLTHYIFESGAILIVQPNRECMGAPAFCNHIGIPVSRDDAADALRQKRFLKQKIHKRVFP